MFPLYPWGIRDGSWAISCSRCGFTQVLPGYHPITAHLALYAHYWTTHPRRMNRHNNQAP